MSQANQVILEGDDVWGHPQILLATGQAELCLIRLNIMTGLGRSGPDQKTPPRFLGALVRAKHETPGRNCPQGFTNRELVVRGNQSPAARNCFEDLKRPSFSRYWPSSGSSLEMRLIAFSCQ